MRVCVGSMCACFSEFWVAPGLGHTRAGRTHLCIGRLRDFPQVILGASGDPAKEHLLCHTPSQHHAHPVKQLLAGEQVLLLRQVLCITQAFPTGNDGHLWVQGTNRHQMYCLLMYPLPLPCILTQPDST